MTTKCKYTLSVIILFAFLAFSACQKAFLGAEAPNDPVNNFEIFWNDFDQHYALFSVRNRNWDSLYQVYQPQVTPTTTDEELWTFFTEMIEHLDDGHTNLFDPGSRKYSSGFALGEKAKDEFSRDLVEDKYLDSLQIATPDSVFTYGRIKDKSIGYIHLFGMSDNYAMEIDKVLNELKQHEAIIVDIRNNGGGDGDFSGALAGAFADGEHFIFTAQTRNGPNYNDFDEPKKFFTKPRGSEQFLKPVILLTDRATVSAAEEFLWHMNAFDHVTQIGDTSAGDLSDLSNFRFLPNGWIYTYSIQMYLTPDGKSLDGVGFIPEVFIKNTETDIEAGNDLVMERAFEYLKEEYGIE